jgi:integrase
METLPIQNELSASIAPVYNHVATSARRKRGPCLSRRTGQVGAVFQRCESWSAQAPTYGKFWVDVPAGDRKQKTVSLGPCATKTIARQRLREYIEKAGVNSRELFREQTSPATTFKQQSEKWLEYVATRTRKPVKPATITAWQDALNAWVLPNIGDKLLADVSNNVLRELVCKMTAAELSAKTIVNYSQVVKLVVASAVDDNGEQVYPRKWNNDFCQIPIVEKSKQHRPTVTAADLAEIFASVKNLYRVFFMLLAGTGLRIGEAIGLKVSDLSSDCRVLHVERSIWDGNEQDPKTANAIRDVDIPEPLAQVLRSYITGKSGYVFTARTGQPLQPRNVLRLLHSIKKVGFHAFRRFRLTWLREQGVPKDLEHLWMGHADEEVGDLYSKLKENKVYRSLWCERIGLGFSCDTCDTNKVVPISAVKVA